MIALGLLAHWLGFSRILPHKLIDSVFSRKGEEIVSGSKVPFSKGFTEHVIVEARKNKCQPGRPVYTG